MKCESYCMLKRWVASFVALPLALCASAFFLASCSNNAAPEQWTLWYIPNEPAIVVPFSRECHTFVFAAAPDAKTYRVAIVKPVAGPNQNNVFFHSGDRFTGGIELGPATLHDVSAGYDINVNSVYRISSYVAAKARADADCPPPKHPVPTAAPQPNPSPTGR